MPAFGCSCACWGQLGSAPLQLWLFEHRLFLRREKNFEKTLAVLFFVAIIRPTSIKEATRDGEFEMIEQKMRLALPLLAGLLLSAGAWGQTVKLEQSVDYRLNVASEFFGDPDGRAVTTYDTSPNNDPTPVPTNKWAAIRIAIKGDPTADTGMLGEGNKASLTFVLTGATFNGAVTANSLKLRRGTATAELPNIVKTITAGGADGDDRVTFELSVTSTLDLATAPASDEEHLLFEVPGLTVKPTALTQGATPVTGVRVDANIRPISSTSNAFPRLVLSATPDTGATPGTKSLGDARVISLHSALGASLGAGGIAQVAIDNLKAIASGTEVNMGGGAKPLGLTVGSLIVALADPTGVGSVAPLDFNGAAANQSNLLNLAANARTRTTVSEVETLNADLQGRLSVVVSGPFQEGDRVFLGADQSGSSGRVFGESGEARSTDVVLRSSMPGTPVVYVPGGVEDLRPGMFNASLSLLPYNPANLSGPVAGAAGSSRGEIRYKDITTQAYAYGVVRGGGIENSYIRVGCLTPGTPAATAASCNVYMACFAQDGTSYFGSFGAIGNNATRVINSREIHDTFDPGWTTGRGRCDLMSNGKLEVQHMVRTSGGQVNNSLVIDQGGIK